MNTHSTFLFHLFIACAFVHTSPAIGMSPSEPESPSKLESSTEFTTSYSQQDTSESSQEDHNEQWASALPLILEHLWNQRYKDLWPLFLQRCLLNCSDESRHDLLKTFATSYGGMHNLINAFDTYYPRFPLLHLSVELNDKTIVQQLFNDGYPMGRTTDEGHTAIDYAPTSDMEQLLKTLNSYQSQQDNDHYKNIAREQYNTLKRYLKRYKHNHAEALCDLIKENTNNHRTLACLLLKRQPSLANGVNQDGESPLQVAIDVEIESQKQYGQAWWRTNQLLPLLHKNTTASSSTTRLLSLPEMLASGVLYEQINQSQTSDYFILN